MFELLISCPLLGIGRLWYCLPLIASISLVYGATRHELMVPILEHALRFGVWIITFMLAIFAVTIAFSWFV
jgi:hypothetical protein